MMYRPILFLCLLLLAPLPVWGNSVESAFAFAERGDWASAMREADSSSNSALVTLMTWQYALDSSSGASFGDITSFITAHSDWPEQKRLRLRAELAIREGEVSHSDIISWFEGEPPVTGIGKIALARALTATGGTPEAKIKTLVRQAWKDGDFDEVHEKDILSTFRKMLTADDHAARTNRLLWEEKTAAANRMLPLLSKDRQYLANARIALIKDKRLSAVALARVPKELKNDPGLVYDRMQYRVRRDDDDGVQEMLLSAPESPPYPEKWWRAREMQVRVAIDEKNYKMAEKLLTRRGKLPTREEADAAWLSGWLQLEFLGKPQPAYDTFSRMHDSVGYPVSRSRAAYWAGRAAEAAGNKTDADAWYAKARAYPTTFYGQLGALKSNGTSPLRFPPAPEPGGTEQTAFDSDELSIALRLCLEHGAQNLANRLIGALIEEGSPERAVLVAKLTNESDYPFIAVRAAKKALQKNIVLIEDGYPRIKTPGGLAVERPLLLAVARQESEFDPRAVSPSGARGLIQLMPRTAKETAKKSGLPFDKESLFEPDYNFTIGSEYLSRMIENYDGSYVMAIAAYNAGPGNVKKWVRRVGTPGNDFDNAINWIEKIPFAETRNYVQRVMENLQVYRNLEAEGNAPRLTLAEDLVR